MMKPKTKTQLEKMTKRGLEEYGETYFGAVIPMSLTKRDMVTMLLGFPAPSDRPDSTATAPNSCANCAHVHGRDHDATVLCCATGLWISDIDAKNNICPKHTRKD